MVRRGRSTIPFDEAKAIIEKSGAWAKRCALAEEDLPQPIRGLPKMTGYLATYFSGSLAQPDGTNIGSFDSLREDFGYQRGEVGRFKKYVHKLVLNESEEVQAFAVGVIEVPKPAIAGHHAADMEDEFLVLYIGDVERTVPDDAAGREGDGGVARDSLDEDTEAGS